MVTMGTSSTVSPGCGGLQGAGHHAGLRQGERAPAGPQAEAERGISSFVVVIQAEELADEIEPGEVLGSVLGAQAAARVMEDLAHQRAGQALELLVGLGREAGEGVGQLLLPDLLGLLLHARDQRLGVEAAEPGRGSGRAPGR